MTHPDSIRLLRDSLAALEAGRIDAGRLAQTWRCETALLHELPPRYGEVLEDVLIRLESTALFDQESCSFSQRDLAASLAAWLGKAEQFLARH